MDINIQKTRANILAWVIEDTISLFCVYSFVEQFYSFEARQSLKITTLDVIKNLLTEKLVLAGDLLEGNVFIPWEKSIEEIISEIKYKWDSLNRELIPHEIVWFEVTAKGKKEFEYLNSLQELKETNLFYFNDEIRDILNIVKPQGQLIGEKGKNSYIRQLKKGKEEAYKIFNQLTTNGKIIFKNEKKIIAKLSEDLYVIYRSTSVFGSPYIDIRSRDFSRNIKLIFGVKNG